MTTQSLWDILSTEQPITKKKYVSYLDNALLLCETGQDNPEYANYIFQIKNKLDQYEDKAIPVAFYFHKETSTASYYVIN